MSGPAEGPVRLRARAQEPVSEARRCPATTQAVRRKVEVRGLKPAQFESAYQSSLILSRLKFFDRVFVPCDRFYRVVLRRPGRLWRPRHGHMRPGLGRRNVSYQLRGQDRLLFGLVLIGAVSQNKLDGALLSGEYELLGVPGAQEQGDDVDGLRLALGIGLKCLPGGEDIYVLQDGLGEGSGSIVRAIGQENVDMRAGIKEAGDTDDVVGANGNGTHAIGNLNGQSEARAGSGQIVFDERLIGAHWVEEGATEDLLRLGKCAGKRH